MFHNRSVTATSYRKEKAMDKDKFTSMLERRGYTNGVHFVEKQGVVQKCLVGDDEATTGLVFSGDAFEKMTYEEACDYIDDTLGQEMRHVVHTCGQILLEANDWWSGMGPYNDFELGFYLVPLHWGSKPVDRCPSCQENLSLEGGDLTDEEGELMDMDTYEEERPTVLPRVTDPEIER
jgi:hypothetical protein